MTLHWTNSYPLGLGLLVAFGRHGSWASKRSGFNASSQDWKRSRVPSLPSRWLRLTETIFIHLSIMQVLNAFRASPTA